MIFFNSFLNNNSISFTDLYQNFQFLVLLYASGPQELIYVFWFWSSKYIKPLQHMKNSTVTTEFASGVMIISNNYTECEENEY